MNKRVNNPSITELEVQTTTWLMMILRFCFFRTVKKLEKNAVVYSKLDDRIKSGQTLTVSDAQKAE